MTIAGPSRLGPRIARLPHKSVLEVSGPDARKFLNGQSCKNIEALGGGYSGFLNASVGLGCKQVWRRSLIGLGTYIAYMFHLSAIAYILFDQSRIYRSPYASTDFTPTLQITIKSSDKGCLGRMGYLGRLGWRDRIKWAFAYPALASRE